MKNIRITVDDNIYLDILVPLLDVDMCNRFRSKSKRDNDKVSAIMKYNRWEPIIYPVRDRLRITLKQKL